MNYSKKVLGFAAYSGTGKTTLLTKIIPMLVKKGVRVGVIKHAHHSFDVDNPEKDSYKLRKSGATEVLISSSNRWALVHENYKHELELNELLNKLSANVLDLVLVEGFKHENFKKIELHRTETKKPYIFTNDENVIAIASDKVPDIPFSIPNLDINQPKDIVNFILSYIKTTN
jgi:molybdopterin molybdotransferase